MFHVFHIFFSSSLPSPSPFKPALSKVPTGPPFTYRGPIVPFGSRGLSVPSLHHIQTHILIYMCRHDVPFVNIKKWSDSGFMLHDIMLHDKPL